MKYIINRKRSSLTHLFFNLLITATIRFFMLSGLIAQPSLIHLSLGPKLSDKEATPVSITWHSDKPAEQQYVRYGTDPDRRKFKESVIARLCGDSIYIAELKHLIKGTRYYYNCGSEKAGWSPVYSFSSEPDSGILTVAVIGDTQNSSDNSDFKKTRIIADLAKSYNPGLTLHMGDIVENGSVPDNWKGFLSATQELNATSPLMPVLGNHDIQNEKGDEFQKPFQEYLELFNLPGDEVNYSFSYMNVRFIGIFSGYAQVASGTDKLKYRPDSPEYKWLDDELSKAETDEEIDWIIVWMHYPVYSFGWSNISQWKKNLSPLFERHRIDLCLSGHRHVYERFYPFKNGTFNKKTDNPVFNSDDGTVFITNGSAGGNPTGTGGSAMNGIAFTAGKPMYTYAVMHISSDSLSYKVLDEENNLIDKFSIIK